MGKSRNKNKGGFSGPRVNPIAVAANGAPKVESDEEALNQIYSELTAGTMAKKEVACCKLGMIAEKMSDKILGQKLVRIVAPLMTSDTDGVQLSAVGALKSLSMVSEEVCEEMVAQDVMTPLVNLIEFYNKDWKTTVPDDITTLEDLLIDGVALLSNLCEASPLALDVFNKANLVRVLLHHLDASKFGYPVVTSVLQCVYSVTENNPTAAEAVKCVEGELEALLALPDASASHLYVRILVCGVILNVAGTEPSKVIACVVDTVSKVLSQDQRKMASEFTDLIPRKGAKGVKQKPTTKNDEEEMMQDESDAPEEAKKVAEEEERRRKAAENMLRDVILGQQTALEILTNLCCDQTDDEDMAEMPDSDSDDMQEVVSGSDFQSPVYVLTIPSEVTEAIASQGLVQSVLAKANLPEENVMDILRSEGSARHLVKLFTSLRVRAFLCLNNVISTLSVDDLGGTDALFSVWSNLGLLCFKEQTPKPGEELLESATSAMRASTHKLLESKPEVFNNLEGSDFDQMVRFGADSPFATVRINMVQIIGGMGVANTSGPASAGVTAFLLDAAAKDADVRVVAEALDKIFDMFAEDDTDRLAVETNLVPRLKGMVAGFKAKVGMERRKNRGGEFDTVVNMAKTNLSRFIKYKEKRPTVAASLAK